MCNLTLSGIKATAFPQNNISLIEFECSQNKFSESILFLVKRYLLSNYNLVSIKSLLKNKYILFFTVVVTDLLLGILTALLLEQFFPSSFENIGGIEGLFRVKQKTY